nr:hypothetical protein GCM10020093_107000 [Planobispora longispora]
MAGFLGYQAMVSLGFAIGFVWLHERLMPYWLLRLRGHNPYARELLDRYVAHAEVLRSAAGRRRTRKGRGDERPRLGLAGHDRRLRARARRRLLSRRAQPREPSFRECVGWVSFYVLLAGAFGAGLLLAAGPPAAASSSRAGSPSTPSASTTSSCSC